MNQYCPKRLIYSKGVVFSKIRLNWLLLALCCLTPLAGCTSQNSANTAAPTVTTTPSPIASPLPTLTSSPTQTVKPETVKTIERKLQAMASEAGVPTQTVDCPASIELKPGNRFDCEATVEGKPFAIAVELTDEKGQFQWSTRELLLLSKLEQYIQQRIKDKSGVEVTANCGGQVRVAKPGETFECQVKTQDQSRSMRVTVKDEKGSVDIRLL